MTRFGARVMLSARAPLFLTARKRWVPSGESVCLAWSPTTAILTSMAKYALGTTCAFSGRAAQHTITIRIVQVKGR